MSQKCWECGRVTPYGRPLEHFPGCVCEAIETTETITGSIGAAKAHQEAKCVQEFRSPSVPYPTA